MNEEQLHHIKQAAFQQGFQKVAAASLLKGVKRYGDLLQGGFGGSLEKLRMRTSSPETLDDLADTMFRADGEAGGALGQLLKNEEKKVLLTRLLTGGGVGATGLGLGLS